ncbi:NAD(P)-binding protein [Fibrella sp. WM1]|uniref:NAD(P)-binding protein n=1 Tax=Fibrella musci TaxID=3242485 RepID=UPI00351F8BB5
MDEVKYLILGCGYAGMTAAKCLFSNNENDYLIVEQNNKPGGIASSFRVNDFTFDIGIHGLYTKNKSIIDVLNPNNQSADKISIKIADYYKGFWTNHPAYFHLKGMPEELISQIILELRSLENDSSKIESFKDWSYRYLGKTYSDEIQIPYTEKFWSTSAEKINYDWIEHRLMRPTIDDILNGISNDGTAEHYVKHLYYPQENGFGEIANKYSKGLKIKYNYTVNKIDTKNKTVQFADESQIKYHKLIYTLPLI